MLSRKQDALYVAEVIAAWASRYMDDEPKSAEAPSSKPGEVIVQETGEGRFAQTISVGGKHSLRADEPPSYGGTDTGPTPYDLLLSGLGACTIMTIRMYAARKKIPLTRASVTLHHDKIHAEDCETCETQDGKIDKISRSIKLEGDLTEEQRQTLLEIAEKCPVHRTLHSEVLVESTLMET